MLRLQILILLTIPFFVSSQVIETSLSHNSILFDHTTFNGKTQISFTNIGDREIKYTCILPGASKDIEIDTTGFGADCTVIINKVPNSGLGEILDKQKLTYTANSGIIFQLDTISLKICNSDSSNCDEFFYYFAVERPSVKYIQPTINVVENTKSYFTLPLNQVPSPTMNLKLIGNIEGTQAVGYVEAPDKFVFYSARGGYSNELSVIACDAYCVCDTFVYKVNVKTDTIDLPFLDDFSYSGPYPDPKLWINDDVFINNTFAIKQPSIGVATFDGTNSGGSPYLGGNGISDYLTSQQIDLGKYNAGSNVYLSFFVEPKGLGNAPEDIDSLVLEFKNKNGRWDKIQGFVPGFPLMIDSFMFQSISITSDNYLYKGFQFRFRNRSDNSGMLDNWHLDYISLSSGIIPSIFSSDIAFNALPKGILKNYTAMPWTQFENFEENELNLAGNNLYLSIDLHNFFNKIETADPSNLKITEKNSGTTLVNNLTLLELPPLVPEDQRNLSPGFHHFDSAKELPTFLNQIKDNFNGGDEYRFITEYTIGNSSESNLPAVKRNNKVSMETNMSYYYAYDDGTAESNIAVKKNGSRGAVKFHANVGDTLRAIQMFIPRVFNDVSKQLMNILVWKGSLDSEPIHSDLLVKPFYLDKLFDTLQGYTTYVLMDESLSKDEPVYIPAGDFFVGWQQATDDEFPVTIGFDKNNPSAAKNSFVNLASGWQSLESLNFQGAIMIRPVIGEKKLNHSPDLVSTDEFHEKVFEVSPNPASNRISIKSNDDLSEIKNVEIFNLQGVLIKRSFDHNQIDIAELQNGMYLLKINTRTGFPSEIIKFIVSN